MGTGFEDTDALASMLAADGDYSNSDLPYGYSYDRNTGITYRQTPEGELVPAVPAEVIRAKMAEAAMARQSGGGNVQNPNYQMQIDPRSGEIMMFDPRTGSLQGTGQQGDFAQIDPREKAAADERERGFDRAYNARQQTIGMVENSQNNVIKLAQMAEEAKANRAGVKSAEARARWDIEERARQADLSAAVDQWKTAMNLIPAMGQLSIQESERVQGVLQNGGDYLARAFESSGGKSPLRAVLQGEQISALQNTLGTLRGMVDSALKANPVARGGALSSMPDTQYGDYAAPDVPRYEDYNLPELPQFGAYQFSGPQAVGQNNFTPVGPMGGGGGGGFDIEGYLASMDNSPEAAMAVKNLKLPGGNFEGDEAPNSTAWQPYAATGPGLEAIHDQRMDDHSTASAPGGKNRFAGLGNPAVYGADDPFGVAQAKIMLSPLKYAADQMNPVGWAKNSYAQAKAVASLLGETPASKRKAARGYARGTGDGFMRDSVAVVGDSLDNQPNPETILNPTNAPIAVVSERFGKTTEAPKYGDGTDFFGFAKKVMGLKKKWDDMYGGAPAKANVPVKRPTPPAKIRPTASPSNVPVRKYATGTGLMTDLPQTKYSSGFNNGFGNYQSGQPLAGKQTVGNWYDEPGNQRFDSISGSGIQIHHASNDRTAAQQALIDDWNRGGQANNLAASGLDFAQWVSGGMKRQYAPPTPQDAAAQAMAAAAAAEQARLDGIKKQDELVDLSRTNLPPRPRAVMNGTAMPLPTAMKSTRSGEENVFQKVYSARQLQALNDEDLKALGTASNVEFNNPLANVTDMAARVSGARNTRQRYGSLAKGF